MLRLFILLLQIRTWRTRKTKASQYWSYPTKASWSSVVCDRTEGTAQVVSPDCSILPDLQLVTFLCFVLNFFRTITRINNLFLQHFG